MAANTDGSVTIKTTGKVAATPVGSGTGKVTPVAAKRSAPGPKVVRVPGRGPVPATRA
jgi:hypothetical protein